MEYIILTLIALAVLLINLKSFWNTEPGLFKSDNEKFCFKYFSFLISLLPLGFLYADHVKTLPFWIAIVLWLGLASFLIEMGKKNKCLEAFKKSKQIKVQKFIVRAMMVTVFIHLFIT